MYVIPGNHETEGDIAALCSLCPSTVLRGGQLKIGGTYVAGLGYSNPTPFDTPGEYSEDELSTRLAKFDGLSPLVMIAHAPPLESKLDRVKPRGCTAAAALPPSSLPGISLAISSAVIFMKLRASSNRWGRRER